MAEEKKAIKIKYPEFDNNEENPYQDEMDKVIDENLKNKYSDTFVYILKKMLDTDEEERFNFEQLVDFVENKYDQEGNLKEENSDNGNKNININKENNRGKFSPIRKKFKK